MGFSNEPPFDVPDVMDDDASEWEVSPAKVLRTDLGSLLLGAHDAAEALSKQSPSRSLSTLRTKLDEAQFWLSRLNEEGRENGI